MWAFGILILKCPRASTCSLVANRSKLCDIHSIIVFIIGASLVFWLFDFWASCPGPFKQRGTVGQQPTNVTLIHERAKMALCPPRRERSTKDSQKCATRVTLIHKRSTY